MKRIRHVFWETILILASVLIFRSLWSIMDAYLPFKEITILWVSLFIGLTFAAIAVYILSHDNKY